MSQNSLQEPFDPRVQKLYDEVKKRLRKSTPEYAKFKLCIKNVNDEEAIRYMIRKHNYCLVHPSSWSLKTIDGSILLQSYIEDNIYFEPLNSLIKPPAKNVIRLMTYNVHYWTDVYDKRSFQEFYKILADTSPDIIAIQEALMPITRDMKADMLTMEGYLNDIQKIDDINIKDFGANRSIIHSTDGWKYTGFMKKMLEMGYSKIMTSVASVTHAGDDTIFGNSIISGSRNIDYQYVIPAGISLKSYGYQGRSATIAMYENVKIKGAKSKGLILITTHLDVFDYSGEVRRKQLNQILDILKSMPANSEEEKVPIVIIGDFNALKYEDYNNATLSWLKKNRGTDFETVKLLEDYGFQDVFIEGSLKYTSWAARRIDYVYVKNIPLSSIKNTYTYYSNASDHIPLIVDIELE